MTMTMIMTMRMMMMIMMIIIITTIFTEDITVVASQEKKTHNIVGTQRFYRQDGGLALAHGFQCHVT